MPVSLYLPLFLSFCLSCRPTLHLSLSLHSYILSSNSHFLLLTRSLPLSLSLTHSLFPTLFLSHSLPLHLLLPLPQDTSFVPLPSLFLFFLPSISPSLPLCLSS